MDDKKLITASPYTPIKCVARSIHQQNYKFIFTFLGFSGHNTNWQVSKSLIDILNL